MFGLADVDQIASALAKYGIEDNAATRAEIRLVWNAWPVVANALGGYTRSSTDKTLNKNAVAFRAKLAELTKVKASRVTLIASAIVDAFMSGKLDQKNFDPQAYKAVSSAKSALTQEIVESGGGSFTDKLLSVGSGLKNAWPWIKWGGLGIGLIVLLVLVKPYTAPVLAYFKKKKKASGDD